MCRKLDDGTWLRDWQSYSDCYSSRPMAHGPSEVGLSARSTSTLTIRRPSL